MQMVDRIGLMMMGNVKIILQGTALERKELAVESAATK